MPQFESMTCYMWHVTSYWTVTLTGRWWWLLSVDWESEVDEEYRRGLISRRSLDVPFPSIETLQTDIRDVTDHWPGAVYRTWVTIHHVTRRITHSSVIFLLYKPCTVLLKFLLIVSWLFWLTSQDLVESRVTVTSRVTAGTMISSGIGLTMLVGSTTSRNHCL